MRKNDGLGNQQVLQVNDLDVFLTKWFIEITTKILKEILQCEFSITHKKIKLLFYATLSFLHGFLVISKLLQLVNNTKESLRDPIPS